MCLEILKLKIYFVNCVKNKWKEKKTEGVLLKPLIRAAMQRGRSNPEFRDVTPQFAQRIEAKKQLIDGEEQYIWCVTQNTTKINSFGHSWLRYLDLPSLFNVSLYHLIFFLFQIRIN